MKFMRLIGGLALTCLAWLTFTTAVRADNPPWPPTVMVLAFDPAAAEEGSEPATFLVVRTGLADAALTVQYDLGGTAQNGIDYQPLSGSVTIPAGAWYAPVTITPIDDFDIEGTESVVLALQQPAQWPPPYIITWPSVAFAEIADNDRAPTNQPPSVTLVSPPEGAIFEANDDIPLVARAADRDGRVLTVEFFAGTNRLGIVTNRPIAVAPDQLFNATADPAFDLAADRLPDIAADPNLIPVPLPGQLYRLVWANVPPGKYALSAVATDDDGATTQSAGVTILVLPQPPQPVVDIRAIDPIAREPDPTASFVDTATFRICRSGPTNLPLPVYYAIGGTASNGADYQELPNSVVIAAGDRFADVTVIPLADNLVEGPESVVVTVLPPICPAIFPPPPDCYLVGRADTAKAVILDSTPPTNQPPLVRLVKPHDGEIFLAPADIRLAALARDFDGHVVTVEFFEGTHSLGIVTNQPSVASAVLPPFSLVWSNVPPGRYVLTAVATDNGGATTRSCPVEIKVVPQVVPPEVNLLTLDPEAAETLPGTPANPALFSVTRTGNTNLPLVVFYSIGGTAANGVDYDRLPGWVLIPAGASASPITVQPTDDNLVEGLETVILKLEPSPILAPASAGPAWWYRIGTNNVGAAVIRDNDVNLSPKVEIVHPASGAIFRENRDISIDVVTVDPDGWVGKVEFYANEKLIGEQQIRFIVAPPPGQPQKFSLVWSNVPAGDYSLTAKAYDDRGAVSVSDPVPIQVRSLPPVPVVAVLATDPIATEPNPLLPVLPDTATFTVIRDGDATGALTVFYRVSGSASNGVDYVDLPGWVTIPAGAKSVPVVVTPLDDHLIERTESVVLTLLQPPCITSNVISAGCYLVGEPDRAIAFIRDNDSPSNRPPTVAIVSPANGARFVAPADVRLVAAAQDPDGWVATVEFFDGTNSLGIVSNNVCILSAPLVWLPDVAEGVLTDRSLLQPFSLVWSNVPPGRHLVTALATDNCGRSARSHFIEVNVLDASDVPVVNIMALDSIAREGATNTATFRVRRVGSTNQPLTVYYSVRGTASNGVDYVAIPSQVTIPAGRHGARIVIQPLDDQLIERVETVILRLTQPPGGPTTYQIGRPAGAAALILDNDRPALCAEVLSDGTPHLSLPAMVGVPYRLEASDDLINWEAVAADTAADATVDYVGDDPSNYPHRFLRVMPEFGDVEVE